MDVLDTKLVLKKKNPLLSPGLGDLGHMNYLDFDVFGSQCNLK